MGACMGAGGWAINGRRCLRAPANGGGLISSGLHLRPAFLSSCAALPCPAESLVPEPLRKAQSPQEFMDSLHEVGVGRVAGSGFKCEDLSVWWCGALGLGGLSGLRVGRVVRSMVL